MSQRQRSRVLLGLCHPAFVALCLLLMRPQVQLFVGLGRFVLSFFAASLLLFVVRSSLELAKTDDRLATIAAFRLTTVAVGVWLHATGDFNPDEPVLPFRFQRPPPTHTL